MDLLQREHPLILAGIGEGIENSTFSVQNVQKRYNIHEIRQGMTKVTIEVQSKVAYALSIGAKSTTSDDPLSEIQGH